MMTTLRVVVGFALHRRSQTSAAPTFFHSANNESLARLGSKEGLRLTAGEWGVQNGAGRLFDANMFLI